VTTDTTDTEPTVEDFDPAAWLSGATGTQRSVTIYGRADLIAEVDELDRQARVARAIPDGDRALGDPTPETVEEQRDALYAQFEASALTVRIEGKSDARRDGIDKRLKGQGIKLDKNGDEQTLHYIADAVVSPQGLDAAFWRAFREKSEAQYREVVKTYVTASGAPPRVTLPFSPGGSQARTRGTSS